MSPYEIHQVRALPVDGSLRLRSWIEGHRDTDRGHEFELFTEAEDAAGTAWQRLHILTPNDLQSNQAGFTLVFLGEVGKPGVFAFQTPMSASESISLAGGFTIHAQDKSVMVIRGDKDNPQLIKLDLRSALREGNAAQNIQLQGGDTVFVPATYIADVSKFAVYLSKILWPISLFTRDVVWVTE